MLRLAPLLVLLAILPTLHAEDPAPAAAASTTPAAPPAASTHKMVTSEHPEAGQKVAFLGDSITQFGFQHPAGYVNLVDKAMELSGKKIEVIPAGISGNTSKNMVDRIKGVLAKNPDWMTLSCGVNDVWHGDKGCTLDEYKTNITSIVDQAAAAGTKVVILTATLIQENPDNDFNKKALDYNAFLHSLAKEKNLTLVDLNADEIAALAARKAANLKGGLTVDGVHMNGYGDQMMATGILKGFGLTDAQIATAKQTWDTMPGAFNGPPVGLSIKQYEKLLALADAQKKSPNALFDELAQKAIADLMATPVPESDPAASTTTNSEPVKK